jgi:hypothetical protein
MVLVDVASTILTTYTALATSIIAVVGVALKFALSHSHGARLVALETKAEHFDEQIGTAVNEVNANKDKIMKGVAVADVVVPQLSQAAADHAKQIADLNAAVADVTSKINLINSVIPQTKQPV